MKTNVSIDRSRQGRRDRKTMALASLSLLTLLSARASAENLGDTASAAPNPAPAATASAASTPAAVPPAPPAPPYSLPWQLRPVAVGNVVRSDTAVAFYDSAGNSGSTVATMLTASYKVAPNVAPMLRLGWVDNAPPGTALGGQSFVNPILGVTYARPAGPIRLAGFFAVTVPVGTGGGNTPDAGIKVANKAGASARSAMDNAMFAVNYFTAIGGVGAAFVSGGFTAQLEATVFQMFRTRGETQDKDSSRTNSTAGLHLGYFVIPQLSFGGEVRYQRWLSTPTMVVGDATARESVTMAIGPRAHFKVAKYWLRPGIAYARALDKPLTNGHYNMLQVDLPFAF